MWALIVYVVFVLIFGFVAYEVAKIIESQTSEATSLIVFLALFFGNFVVAWWATVFTVERMEKKAAQSGT